MFKPEICNEYTLIKTENIKELNSTGYLLMHNKTNARIAIMANEDQNKVFSIGFRTPVENDTGVAHIVEHTVLCGSEKYPLKDPFVELVKGSMNTFLNAMTFPDKTIYPVASLNDKDFNNLMDVYLDAVFNPRIYDKEEIFAKEGWHYTVSESGELGVNGIVYNEMKGVFSKPEDVIMSKAMEYLFPDTCYRYESGGDPEHIYELSYDEYKDFHSRYYHPSNSFIFLYGDMDFNEKLEYIDKEYLCKYDYLRIDSSIKSSKDFEKPVYATDYYSVSEGEDIKDKDYLAYVCTAGDGVDTELYYAMKVLDYTLVSMPGAPVKKALIDAGIGEDIFGGEQNLKDRFFMIAAKYANASEMEKFKDTIENTLRDIVKNGIDKDSLRAALNILEFNYREGDFGSYPKGIFYLMDSFESWLYDDQEPFLHLKAGGTFEYLNKMVETDYFEKLVEKYLLNNNHKVYLTLAAKPGLLAKRDEELKNKLEEKKASWTDEEFEKAVSLEKAIEKYVNSEDSEEDLRKIPVLELSDLKKEAEHPVIEDISGKIEGFDGKGVLYSNIPTNGIAYMMVGFDIENVPTDNLPYIGLLKYIICNIDTEKYKYMDLNNIVNMNSGGLSNDISGIIKNNNNSDYMFTFDTNIKIFYNKMQFAFEIIEEMLLHSKISDVKRLKEIIAEAKSGLEEGILGQGNNTAIARAKSNYSEASYFSEKMSGLDFYMFIKDLYENFDTLKDEIIEKLNSTIKLLFVRENVIVHLTAEECAVDSFISNFSDFMNKLPDEKYENATRYFTPEHRAEAFKTPSSVQFVARSGSYKAEGFSYSGTFKVLSNILAYGYLWENIREKGGAYGCMYRPTKSGKISFSSYRDPKLKETNEVYDNLPGYLRGFEATDRLMLKYIIGAISTMDTPKTPRAKGSASLSAYLAGISYDEIQKERDEILSTTSDDIRDLAETFETALSNSSICVIGNADKIEECKEMFTDIIEIIK